MKRAVVVLLLMIANAIVSSGGMTPLKNGVRKSLVELKSLVESAVKSARPPALAPERERGALAQAVTLPPPPRQDRCIPL